MFKDDYFTNLNSMSMPWVESPFFNILLKQSGLSDKDKQIAKNYNRDGYVVIDTGLSSEEICKINDDVESVLESNRFEGQEKYEYTNHRKSRLKLFSPLMASRSSFLKNY